MLKLLWKITQPKGKRSNRLFIFQHRTKRAFRCEHHTTLHRLLFSCCQEKREVVICHYFVKTLFLSNSICILWWKSLETRTNKPTNWISHLDKIQRKMSHWTYLTEKSIHIIQMQCKPWQKRSTKLPFKSIDCQSNLLAKIRFSIERNKIEPGIFC